jgi:lambda family phage portal protein
MLRGISSGLLVSYESLTGDLSKVNFSSIRAGAIVEQDIWRDFQAFFKEHLFDDVFSAWTRNAYLAGALAIQQADYDRVLESAAWQARGWGYVNPQQEVEADVVAINNGLDTITSVLADRGLDIEEVIAERKAEMDLFAQYGVPLPAGDQAQTKFSGKQDSAPADGNSDAADTAGNSDQTKSVEGRRKSG